MQSLNYFLLVLGTMLTKTLHKDILQKESCFAILTNLKPLTTYMITVSIITNYGKGLIHSETVFDTTLGKNATVEYEEHTKNSEVKYNLELQEIKPYSSNITH